MLVGFKKNNCDGRSEVKCTYEAGSVALSSFDLTTLRKIDQLRVVYVFAVSKDL
jgi:hypothetical protein